MGRISELSEVGPNQWKCHQRRGISPRESENCCVPDCTSGGLVVESSTVRLLWSFGAVKPPGCAYWQLAVSDSGERDTTLTLLSRL